MNKWKQPDAFSDDVHITFIQSPIETGYFGRFIILLTSSVMEDSYYVDKGTYNFIYQIPQILYSTLISGVINALIKYLSLSENDIIAFKQEKDNIKNKYKELIKTLKMKFILFFIITFMLLMVFWYYITCFCGVYSNTQIHLIKDTVTSFCLSLVYPFGIYLIPAMFRKCALNSKKKKRECIYKTSLIIQMI